MEAPRNPYAPRSSGRQNAGRRADDGDMVFYDNPPRATGVGNPGSASAHVGHPVDREHRHVDVTEGDPETEVVEGENVHSDSGDAANHDDVDEEFEEANAQQRPLGDVNQAALNVVTTTPCARGPVIAGNASAGATAVPRAPPVDAALAARLAAREREVHELRSQLRQTEARRTPGPARPAPAATDAPRPRRSANVAPVATVNAANLEPPLDPPRTPFVARALARETVATVGRHGAPTTSLIYWADTLEMAHRGLPGLDNGWKEAVRDGIVILAYDTRVGRMTFWPPQQLMESVLCRTLRLNTRAQKHMLHLVMINDPARSGWFVRKMQLYRNSRWEQGRAYIYVLLGLPYDPPTFFRVTVPTLPQGLTVAPISRLEFTTTHRAGK
ncbi:unnamed protein product [Closterium sp. Naga37s-1]|nr:unnamed protein product [Closterium sp. Naga37s-1]